eukprot:248114_1
MHNITIAFITMSLLQTAASVALFVPSVAASLLTIANVIIGFIEIYYTSYKQKKIFALAASTIHSVCITLYFATLPVEVINRSNIFDFNILLNRIYGEYYIILWVLILTSMYVLQVIRGYIINFRYNYIFMLMLLLTFLTLWMFLIMFKTQYFMDYLVSWFIILVYIYVAYLLYFKQIKVYVASTKLILKYNYDHRHNLVSFIDVMSVKHCMLLVAGWINKNTYKKIFIPKDIQDICNKFIYVGNESNNHNIRISFHRHDISMHLKKRIEANSRMIFVLCIMAMAEFGCVILYVMKIIVYGESELLITLCEIGIDLCLFAKILCDNFIPQRNRGCYNKICIPCKHYMDEYIMRNTPPMGMQYMLMD